MITPMEHSIAESFGIEGVSAMTLGCAANDSVLIPRINPHHHYDRDFLRKTLNFLSSPDGDALFLFGPTGSGKTSGITQVLARLNWPVQSIAATARLEFQDLVGQFSLVAQLPGEDPTMTFVDGPLTSAIRQGHVLLINEVDLMDPGELAGLNDVLEGKPLVISANGGEVVRPHEMFRVVVTGNSAGGGDDTGAYLGVRQQNIATMDRFRFVRVDYLTQEDETQLLSKLAPGLPEYVASKMVEVANQTRQLHSGDGVDISTAGQLGFPMTSRTLRRWARGVLAYAGAPTKLQYALEEAYLARASDVERVVIDRLGRNAFGDDIWEGRIMPAQAAA